MDKVAVIGLGNIATRHRRNLKLIYPDSTLYTMSASGRIPSEEVSDSDEFVSNIDELIQKCPKMVIVASPATSHIAHAIPLIQAGIPTLIEKPVAASSKDSSRLGEALQEHSAPVAIAYCLRYLPSSQKVKTLIDQCYLGEIYNANIQIGQYLPDWRPNKNYRDSVSANKHLGGGALLELSHELDYAQWLLGELNVEHAVLRSSKKLGLEVEDIVDVTLTAQQGAVCTIHLDFLQQSAQRTCSLVGENGRLDWDLIKNTIIFYHGDGADIIYSEPGWDKNKMYISMVQDFKAKIENATNSCVEYNEAHRTIQLVEKIKEKANWSN
jgi:predicted dehydrogenase